MYRIYEVKAGDTLESIASRLGINPEILAAINGITSNTILNPNSYIVVPGNNGYFDQYKVKKGDTIYAIANRYNVSPSELLKLNGLNDTDIIYADETIMVPKPGTGFYVTEDEDTINSITRNLNAPIEEIAKLNDTIYLMPDQLIVYKK